MANLAAQQVPITGVTPTFVAASAGGDSATPDDRTALRVKNASAGAITVTVVVPGSSYGQLNPDVAVSVPATTGDVLIALPPAVLDPATGLVGWTYSAVASVTVALVRI